MENISRRNFMKGVGALAVATAATGLLGGCSDGSLIADATGINNAAEIRGVKMTVRQVLYGNDMSSGTIYVIPKVVIQNNGAGPIPVDPANGSFKVIINGNQEMVLNANTMAELKTMSPITKATLKRDESRSGYLCSKATNVGTPKYVYIVYYPYPEDTKTALRCKILESQWRVTGSL